MKRLWWATWKVRHPFQWHMGWRYRRTYGRRDVGFRDRLEQMRADGRVPSVAYHRPHDDQDRYHPAATCPSGAGTTGETE